MYWHFMGQVLFAKRSFPSIALGIPFYKIRFSPKKKTLYSNWFEKELTTANNVNGCAISISYAEKHRFHNNRRYIYASVYV